MNLLIRNLKSLDFDGNIVSISAEIIQAFERNEREINQEVNYELLHTLFKLDLHLRNKSNACWEIISKDRIIDRFPEYLRDYICKILKNKSAIDPFLYRKKLEEYSDNQAFRYLAALCLIEEGLRNSDKSKIEEALEELECLYHSSNGQNSNFLVNLISIARLRLAEFLPLDAAIKCIEEVRKQAGDNIIFDSLHVYQACLVAVHNAKEALEKEIKIGKEEIKKIADGYQNQNMEVLGLFMTITALIFGIGGCLYAVKSLRDQLMILTGLSLSAIGVFGGILIMLRSKWFVTVGVILFVITFYSGVLYYVFNKSSIEDTNTIQVSNELNIPQSS